MWVIATDEMVAAAEAEDDLASGEKFQWILNLSRGKTTS
jgi:hypothetical protein